MQTQPSATLSRNMQVSAPSGSFVQMHEAAVGASGMGHTAKTIAAPQVEAASLMDQMAQAFTGTILHAGSLNNNSPSAASGSNIGLVSGSFLQAHREAIGERAQGSVPAGNTHTTVMRIGRGDMGGSDTGNVLGGLPIGDAVLPMLALAACYVLCRNRIHGLLHKEQVTKEA